MTQNAFLRVRWEVLGLSAAQWPRPPKTHPAKSLRVVRAACRAGGRSNAGVLFHRQVRRTQWISGVEWLGAVPAHWEIAALKHLVSQPIIDGPHESDRSGRSFGPARPQGGAVAKTDKGIGWW
jgi:hypothetical protein